MIKNNNFKKLFKEISKTIKSSGSKVAVLTHVNPDFDCLGSAFALKEALLQFGKETVVFNTDPCPASAKYIFDLNEICKEPFDNKDFDLVISVDTSTIERLGIFGENFATHPNTIKFDHHLNSEEVGKIYFVNTNVSSCAEIMLELFKAMKVDFTEKLSTYIYAGMITDSGSFKNTNVNRATFEHAIFLTEHGANRDFVHDAIFRTETVKAIAAKKFLYNNYQIVDNQMGIVVVTLADMAKLGINKQDCDNYSSLLLTIEGVKISCSAIQTDEKTFKLSFRSRKIYEISHFCEELGGGGHLNAAGAVVVGSKTLAKQKALWAMKECIKAAEGKQ